MVLLYVSVCTYIQLFLYIWEFYLSINIYNYDNHHKQLQTTQVANHPMCSIVYTIHPI